VCSSIATISEPTVSSPGRTAAKYATVALKSGVNPKVVSARLGHASVGFTLAVYSHALPGMERDAAHKIASMFLDDINDDP
jgi:integrase